MAVSGASVCLQPLVLGRAAQWASLAQGIVQAGGGGVRARVSAARRCRPGMNLSGQSACTASCVSEFCVFWSTPCVQMQAGTRAKGM